MTKPIPISAAKRIAKDYGYDQVIIIARKPGKKGLEHVTTYGINPDHCSIAAKAGNYIKHKLLGWEKQ